MTPMQRESDLYPALKALFSRQGFDVKGEVGAADLVARRGADLVVVEMKLKPSLALYHQAIARLAVTDDVYIAVLRPSGRSARRVLRENIAMARRLGLGIVTVDPQGRAEVHAEPGPYAPRKRADRRVKLLREFDRLEGDPNAGGATRHGIVTSYRQDALRCAAHLAEAGASRGRDVVAATGVARATTLMRDNHYGWFDKVAKGTFRLNDTGREGLIHWAYSWEE